MSIRGVLPVVASIAGAALFSACSGSNTTSPIAPSGRTGSIETVASTSSLANMQITSMSVTDGGPNALGQWPYNVTMYLHETGGTNVVVTGIQVRALVDATVLGTASIAPMSSIPANSSREAAVVLTSGTHVQTSAITANVKVAFKDMKGNTGSVTSGFACFGCWDY